MFAYYVKKIVRYSVEIARYSVQKQLALLHMAAAIARAYSVLVSLPLNSIARDFKPWDFVKPSVRWRPPSCIERWGLP